MKKHVGLFIDFENLIYGLVDRYGEQGAYELFKVQFLFDFTLRYGEVAYALAYADWRMRAVNQWQVDLYGRGVELIHVLGRGGKNAVDIKMAVDLVELSFTHPHIDTYVLVFATLDPHSGAPPPIRAPISLSCMRPHVVCRTGAVGEGPWGTHTHVHLAVPCQSRCHLWCEQRAQPLVPVISHVDAISRPQRQLFRRH